MGILERNKERKARAEAKAQAEANAQAANPAPADVVRPDLSNLAKANQPQTPLPDQTKGWQDMSYKDLVKVAPQWTPAQYLYQKSKYLRDNGMPDMTWAEQAEVLRGMNPYESEEDRQKDEKRFRTASILNDVGNFLGHLVNYTRAKNHSVGVNVDNRELYRRLDRMRQGQLAIDRMNYNDYLGALARDKAEEARQDAAKAAAGAAERKFQHDLALQAFKQNTPYEKARADKEKKQGDYYAARAEGQRKDNEYRPKKQNAELGLIAARTRNADASAKRHGSGGSGTKSGQFIDIQTKEGTKRFTPDQGSNWIFQAYTEMLLQAGKDKEKYKVDDMFESPSNQDMYDAITKYNTDQWKNQYRSGRYKPKDNEKPPLE